MAKLKIEQNKKEKQQALYETAFDLFITKGLTQTTIADIAQKAGVAKGTFYLYFKDKYDIKNRLIVHKARDFFQEADEMILKEKIQGKKAQLHFLVGYYLTYMAARPTTLSFFSKNLSWGLLRGIFEGAEEDAPTYQCDVLSLFAEEEQRQRDSLLLYTIVELVSSSCTNCILYQQPLPIEEYRPFLHRCIDGILGEILAEEKDSSAKIS